MLDVPTLHTIGMSGRLKPRIGQLVDVHPCRQTRGGGPDGHRRGRGFAFVQPSMDVVQRLTHAVADQRVDVVGLGLLEKLGNIAG